MSKWNIQGDQAEKVMQALHEMCPFFFVQEAEKTVPTVPPKKEPQEPRIDIQKDSPNQSNRTATISAIVVHNTDCSFDAAINTLMNSAEQVSAHLVIARDGRTAQLVPFEARAWHAGNRAWNDKSIGIELEADKNNKGMTPAQETTLLEWMRYLMHEFNIPKQNIEIHRHIVDTDCPGWIWNTDGLFELWVAKNF